MIQLFEEDYNLVKRAVTIGTDINSASDPTTGYYDGNLYINSNTLDIWETDGIVWTKKGNLKGIADITEVTNPDDGGLNVINVLLTDGTTKTFTVKNGQKGKDGKDGVDGTDGKDGADGKSIANISLASTSGNVKTYDVLLDDGTKTPTGFSVEDGSSSYLHIRYSSSFDGTGMVTTPTDATVYIGILVSTSSVAPTNPSLYNWVRFIGKSGTGSGDMLSTDYATKYPNTVDKAAALYDGTDEILANQLMKKSVYDADDDGVVDNAKHAVNANKVGNANTSLLEKLSDSSGKLNYNGNALMLEAAQLANQAKLGEFVVNQIGNNVKELALHSDITTKLSKVDTTDNLSVELAKKIDKPASATDGQVLTYNGTSNKWEAKNQSASITEPTNLEKGIIGGDKWVAQSYTKGAIVIYNNKIYYCKADCSASNIPSEPDSNYWEETSISTLKSSLDNIYSTSEVKTKDVWIDGKPIYRKVVYFDSSTMNANISFAHGISNLGDFRCFDVTHSVCRRKSDGSFISLGIPAGVASSDSDYTVACSFFYDNDIQMQFGSKTQGASGYVTLLYTKTTD